ncbi:GAL3ST1 [Branchiostoma lanceolatum]|uniref:GAL3ST1 protein n=1 Tax=Branchiostoma lanceolatum TaxID=7740 RepID=A0A8K0EWS3_BRALA|nr:GAL3ST1 [Branchiostoma lanceolatum]
MMASLPDNPASPGTTTVTAPNSKKPCVRQGFNVLICTVLVAMTYLSIHSDVISVTPNIAQDVALPAASDDTGWSEIDDVAILPKSVMSEVDDVAILPKLARSKINDVAVLPTSVMSEIGGFKRKPGGPCQEKTRLAYIKVHKAGSTTVLYIFQRFGYRRYLHFVLPSRRDVNIGWPYLMKKEDYLQPIPGRPFDLLVDHTVYNREIFRNLLPNSTVYLTIVREPYSHLQSVINFFRLTGRYGMPKDDPGKFFLRSPAELERTYFQSDENKRTPFSKTRNFMAYDLGIPVALSEDEDYVRDYIAELDRDFLLVMVLEYFDESLVLLKRYMCWQLTDILYKVQNSRE